jgi:hypothetical protein
MVKRLVSIGFAVLCLAACACAARLGFEYHDQYRQAHATAWNASTLPLPGPSPEAFFQKAQTAGFIAAAITLLILVVGILIRRIEWFIIFAICLVIAVLTFAEVGVRY